MMVTRGESSKMLINLHRCPLKNELEASSSSSTSPVHPEDTALVDQLSSNTALFISSARNGSLQHLAALANYTRLVPSRYERDVMVVFCAHVNGEMATTMLQNTKDTPNACLLSATSIQGIYNLRKQISENTSFSPLLVKAWPKIERWIEFMDVASKFGDKKSNAMAGGMDVLNKLVGNLLEVALRTKDTRSKLYFRKRVPTILAKRWLTESPPGVDGLIITSKLGPCLWNVDDRTLFLETFIQAANISEKDFVGRLLQKGELLFRQEESNFEHIGDFLFAILYLNETPMWDVLLGDGGLDFVLRVFSALPKQSRCSEGWRTSFELCLKFFNAVSGTKKGYPFLLQVIKGGFFESFVSCGSHFKNLNESDIALCKGTLSLFPKYFYVFAILKAAAIGMEKIGGTKRHKIQGSCLEEEWVALETRLLEQLIRKQFFDIAYQGHAQEICRTCNKANLHGTFSKCAGCRRVLYCSKECQRVDWKEGRHREDCKRVATMEEEEFIDDKMLRKSVEFASMITSRELDRHFASLHSQLQKKCPGHTIGQARLVARPMSSPVVLDIGSAREMLKDTKDHGMRALEEALKKTMISPDDCALWVQICLPEGERETVDVIRLRFPKGGAKGFDPLPGGVHIRRPSAKDSKGQELKARHDEVDQTLQFLEFRSPDEWYSSGRGSLSRLNDKVKNIIIKRRLVSFAERF